MRKETFDYYSTHIRPDRLMSRCLQTALARFAAAGVNPVLMSTSGIVSDYTKMPNGISR
jgi:hypothetical protein